jgi:hypothetical protein
MTVFVAEKWRGKARNIQPGGAEGNSLRCCNERMPVDTDSIACKLSMLAGAAKVPQCLGCWVLHWCHQGVAAKQEGTRLWSRMSMGSSHEAQQLAEWRHMRTHQFLQKFIVELAIVASEG